MRKNSSKTALFFYSLVNLFSGNKPINKLRDNEITQNDGKEQINDNAHVVGSVYNFPLATPGFEALITITGQNSENMHLVNDNHLREDSSHTQTIKKSPSITESEDSWVSFKIDIKNVDVKEETVITKNKFKISLNNLF